MASPCDECESPECYEIVPCPSAYCVDGIWIGTGINGLNEPNWFGLEHPLNFLESCPVCGGKKEIIVWCRYYGE